MRLLRPLATARPSVRHLALRLAVALVAAGSLGASCGQRAVTLMPGVVNDTGNRSLRRALFSFATERICEEMRGRSLPLRTGDADPSVGRFFPTGCAVTELGNENLFVQFVGHGYAWTNVTGRLGFEAAASVEYSQDFFVHGSSMYVYFRQVRTPSSTFKPTMVERADGGVAGAALSVLGRDASTLVAPIGQRVLESQLARGFTVVRDPDGAVAFSLGILEKGQRPPAPFDTSGLASPILAHDRTELHAGQRDFLGPFEIDDAAHPLVLSAALEGAQGVDVFVVPRAAGDTWIGQLERYPQTGPAPAPPLVEDVIPPAAELPNGGLAASYRRAFPLARGSYYLVLDHTTTAGKAAPTTTPGDDRAALVNYVVERGR